MFGEYQRRELGQQVVTLAFLLGLLWLTCYLSNNFDLSAIYGRFAALPHSNRQVVPQTAVRAAQPEAPTSRVIPQTPKLEAVAEPEPETRSVLRTPKNFDCINGKHMGGDWVICASPELLDMEAQLEDAYNAARAARGDSIRHEQLEWIKQHATDCGLPFRGRPSPELISGARDCVMENMKQRLAALQAEQ